MAVVVAVVMAVVVAVVVAVAVAVVVAVFMAVVMAVFVAVVMAVVVAVVLQWLWFSRDVAMRCHIALCPDVHAYMRIHFAPKHFHTRDGYFSIYSYIID